MENATESMESEKARIIFRINENDQSTSVVKNEIYRHN